MYKYELLFLYTNEMLSADAHGNLLTDSILLLLPTANFPFSHCVISYPTTAC